MKSVVGALKLELSQYEEVARFARFGTEVNDATKRQIERGQRVEALLGQGPNRPVKMEDQVVLFYALTEGFMDSIDPMDIPHFSSAMIHHIHNHAAQSVDQIRYHRELDQAVEDELIREFSNFVSIWEKKVKRTS